MKLLETDDLLHRSLQEDNRIFELLVKYSGDVIWIMDVHLHTIYMSPSVEMQLGFTVDEYIALDLQQRLPEDSFQTMMRMMKEQLIPIVQGKIPAPEKPLQLELLHRHKNGQLIWGEITLSFLQDTDGQVKWIMGVTRNINLRRQAQEEVVKNRSRLQSIINESGDWIWEIDADDCFSFSNNAVEQILGLDANDIIGKRPYDFAHGKVAEQQLARFYNLKRSALPLSNFCVNMLHSNGTLKLLDVKANPYFDESGKLMGYRGTCRDMTFDKARTRKIELLEKTHFSLLSNPEFAWIKLDRNFEILEWNKGAMDIFGFSRSETQMEDVLSRILPSTQMRVLKKHFSNPENVSKTIRYSGIALHRDGKKIFCHFAICPYFDENVSPDGGELFILNSTRYNQLLDRNAEYEEVLSGFGDAYIIADKYFRIIHVNESSAKWLGYTVKELIGQPVSLIQCEESLKRIHENGKHVACRKHPWKTGTVILSSPQSKIAELSLFSPSNHKGKQVDFVIIYKEVHN